MTSHTTVHTRTLAELSAGLAAGDYTSVELTKACLSRIEQHDGEINSFITVTADNALAAAKVADDRRAAGSAGPLTGIPLAHKDIFCTQGVKTSCGSKMLDNFVAPYDATVVSRLQEAGMVTLGKTNLDEFAMGSTNESSFFGAVRNPWNTACVPGGSSGGSAAALAAGFAPAATGTDTGGSIRQPASFCGVTGIKPTYGRVSRWGMIAYASSLDQGGVFAKTAEDCGMLLQAISGFDEKDSTSADEAVPDFNGGLNSDLKGKKIGVPTEFFGEGLDAEVKALIETALKQYEAMGCELVEVSLPHMHLSVPAYYVVAPAEASSNLSRFDGVRYGHRCDNPEDLADLYLRSRAEGFGDEVKRRIMIGAYALSAGYYDAYYLKAQRIRRLIRDDFTKAFESVDAIAGPVAPTTAFKLGAMKGDPVQMYLSDVYTLALNLAGLPGMSVPAGFADGMPVGLQLIGKHFDEAGLLNLAHQYQQKTDWHSKMPAAFA